MTWGDFNRDGHVDLATASLRNDSIGVLLGDGNGGFSLDGLYATGGGPYGLAVGDFDEDGILDLANANKKDDTVSVLLGDGAGAFTLGSSYPADSAPLRVVAARLNGDSHLDLALGASASNHVVVLFGQGDGTFLESNIAYGAGIYPWSLVAGDLNRDGGQDLLVTNYFSSDASVLLHVPPPSVP